MLKIRLKRCGHKANPFYLIILINNLSGQHKKALTKLGYYNPFSKAIYFNKPLLYQVLKNGAYPTATVRYLIYTYNFLTLKH